MIRLEVTPLRGRGVDALTARIFGEIHTRLRAQRMTLTGAAVADAAAGSAVYTLALTPPALGAVSVELAGAGDSRRAVLTATGAAAAALAGPLSDLARGLHQCDRNLIVRVTRTETTVFLGAAAAGGRLRRPRPWPGAAHRPPPRRADRRR